MTRSIFSTRKILTALIVIVLLPVAVYMASYLPTADWFHTFDPAARGVFSGQSPYIQIYYVNPPWAVVPLLPIVLLPPIYAHGAMFVVCFALLALIAFRLNASLLTFIFFLLSPATILALMVNNIDSFVISGILLPPIWGLFLLVMKPQLGFGVILYYLIDMWRQHGFWRTAYTFAPVSILWVGSAILFPVWIDRMLHGAHFNWNVSVFPYLIPVGLFFLWLAFRNKNPYFAMASSIFFSPYYSFPAYVVIQIGLMHPDVERYFRRDALQLLLSIFFWVIKFKFNLQ